MEPSQWRSTFAFKLGKSKAPASVPLWPCPVFRVWPSLGYFDFFQGVAVDVFIVYEAESSQWTMRCRHRDSMLMHLHSEDGLLQPPSHHPIQPHSESRSWYHYIQKRGCPYPPHTQEDTGICSKFPQQICDSDTGNNPSRFQNSSIRFNTANELEALIQGDVYLLWRTFNVTCILCDVH